MAKKLRPLPDMGDRAVQMPAGVLDPEYYLTLKMALEVVAEQAAQIETLRVALNETRTDPTTVYPVIPAF
ncbi:hypothetical protein J2X48_000709 [Bosea sp. BE271]|uniref:hypothetical protein n=1 Tax=Bosea TaxID=85413 RepID=UPI0028588FF3|nr:MULTISPECIES: hypothetical protein [Bosea]MDR6826487.1 hypothetical protein [Bosea robiniae]MDR6893197.1 hypothetical protein [Bosea sp. BE109]MDR7137104.1 hypothetical protein [Bosea sp. BE168]MDR7173803.1 hypothetical protein [Bosea sp. BE271]